MLIVAGHFEVDPADQEAFVAGRVESIVRTRAEAGCLEYVMCVDPVDKSRVILLERWEGGRRTFPSGKVARWRSAG